MSLQGNLAAMCANLHAVMDYNHTDAPALYRVTSSDGINRPRWTSQRPQTLKWLGTTPPARIRLSFYEDIVLMPSTDPLQEITGDVIDCGFADPYLGATWFRMVNVDLRFSNSAQIKPVYWVHIQHLGTNGDSIGFFVPGFAP